MVFLRGDLTAQYAPRFWFGASIEQNPKIGDKLHAVQGWIALLLLFLSC